MTKKHTRTKNATAVPESIHAADRIFQGKPDPVGAQADGHSGGPGPGPAQSAEYRPDDPTRGGAAPDAKMDKFYKLLFGQGTDEAQQCPTEAELKAFRLGRFKGMTQGSSVGMEIGLEIGGALARKPLIRHIDKLNRRLGRAGNRVANLRTLLVAQTELSAAIAAALVD